MNDARSATCSNILYINGITRNDILKTPATRIRSQLPVLTIPDSELFRVGLLNILMSINLLSLCAWERSLKVRNIAFSDQIDVRKNLSTSFLTSILMSTLINKSFTFMNIDRCNAIILSLSDVLQVGGEGGLGWDGAGSPPVSGLHHLPLSSSQQLLQQHWSQLWWPAPATSTSVWRLSCVSC